MWGKLVIPVLLASCILEGAEAGSDKPQLPEDMTELVAHIHNTCVGKTGTTEEDITNCEKGIFAEKRELKCYMYCFMEEASLIEDGVMDYDMLIEMIPEQWRERVAKMINACRHLDTPEKDTCDKAFEIHQCLYKFDPGVYFLF